MRMKLPVIKNYGDTNFITGLRAFSALAVVLIHAGGAGLRDLGPIGNHLADLGRTGVYVFFVISGYSASASFSTSNNYFDYLMKRIIRIAPLYYFWLTISVVFSLSPNFWQDYFNTQIDLYNLIMHITFLSFLDYKITNSILGVEWSISIEIFWYIVIPFFIIKLKKFIALMLWILFSFIAYKLFVGSTGLLPLPKQEAILAIHWNPLTYMLAYVLGMFSYRARPYIFFNSRTLNIVFIIMFSVILIYIFNPRIFKIIFIDEIIFIEIITCAFILFSSENTKFIQIFFTNKFVIFIGTISYGVYLSHMPILIFLNKCDFNFLNNDLLKFITLCALTICVSTITYYIIEVPAKLFLENTMKKK